MPTRSLPKPRIFISHSSHEPEAETVRNALVKCLKPDFDVKIDKELLKGGDDFREEIFHWINRAHGAVILFSSSALSSSWVKTEASILAWRRALDKTAFKLVPVLLSPVTRSDIEAKEFSPMRLSTLQLVRSDDPVKICQEVRASLQPLIKPSLPDTPFEKLVRKVAALLEKIKPAELLNTAVAMNLDTSDWAKEEEYPMLLAREMLERGLKKARIGIRQIDDFLGPDDTEKLIHLVAPVWVSIPAASAIPRIATEKDTKLRKLWVNGGDEDPEFTAGHFVRRACCRPPESCWPVLLVGPDSGEDEVGHYKRVIRELLKNRVVRHESASEVTIKKVLANREEDGEPVFVAFSPPGPDPDVIAALRTEFPTLTFFILTGTKASPPLASVQFLEPKLKEDEESNAFAEYLSAMSIIQNPGSV